MAIDWSKIPAADTLQPAALFNGTDWDAEYTNSAAYMVWPSSYGGGPKYQPIISPVFTNYNQKGAILTLDLIDISQILGVALVLYYFDPLTQKFIPATLMPYWGVQTTYVFVFYPGVEPEIKYGGMIDVQAGANINVAAILPYPLPRYWSTLLWPVPRVGDAVGAKPWDAGLSVFYAR